MLYTTFVNKTIIKGELEAIDPIHIGSSARETLDPIEVDSPVLKDTAGNPIIPGSSIKGVIRSQFESIIRAVGGNACDIHNNNDEKCVSKSAAKSIRSRGLSDKETAQLLYDNSCTVCKLFGGHEFAGKLHFKDCYYIGEKPCIYENRDGVGIDRITGAASRSAKYDFEVVPKGTRFDFILIAENLDDEQKKYLELIVGMLQGKSITESDYISVGGKTTRGLGRIKLHISERKEITADSLKAELFAFMNERSRS